MKKKFWTHFFEILQEEKNAVKNIVIATILFNLSLFAIPITIQILINQITLQVYQESTVAIFIFLALFSFGCLYFKTYRLHLIELLQRRLHVRSYEYYSRLFVNWYPGAFEKVGSQQTFHRFFEVFVFQKSFVRVIKDGFQLLIQLIIGLIIISFYHVSFFIYSALLIIVYYYIIKLQWEDILQKNLELSDKKYQSISWLEQISLNRDTFLSSQGTQFAIDRSLENTQQYIEKRSNFFSLFLKQIQQILSIQFIASFILFLIGTFLVYKKQLNLGQFIAAEIIITSIMLSFGKITEVLEDLYDSIISCYKLFSTQQSLSVIQKGGKEIVSFDHYWTISQLLLRSGKKCHTSIHHRSIVAILGKEGSGKTLLVNQMMKYNEEYEGTIFLNNVNIKDINYKSFYSQVSVVRDEPQFFTGSVRDNLLLGNNTISDDELTLVLKQIGIWNPIHNLPEKFETLLTLNGFPLSETYAKLLMIARVMLFKAGTVIIDGVLDSMDDEMINNLIKFFKSREQTIVITTLKNTIAEKVDSVILLD